MHGANHVTITKGQGIKGEGDIKVFVEGKTISIRDVLNIVQEIAENERRINRDKIARTGRFFFQLAVIDAINGQDIEDICKKYLIPEKDK